MNHPMKWLFSLAMVATMAAMPLAQAETTVLTGTGAGKMGDITVEVTVTDGVIAGVQVTSHNETAGICEKAIEQIPAAIVGANSADVDTVSGATVTSEGIIAAVKNAMGASTEAVIGEETYPGEDKVNTIYAEAEEKSKANAPKVTTLDNGVQIQLTPNDVGGYWHRPGNYNSYNTYFLKADQRGCNACHTSLIDVVEGMDYDHLPMSNNYGIEWEVQDCKICHDDGDGYLYTLYDFGTLIHGIHSTQSFDAMGGSCWSCHNATADGNGMMLWEEAKYDVLQGITSVSDVQGDFTWDQTTVTTIEGAEMPWWMSGKGTDSMYGASSEQLPLDEGLFDRWEITVDGDVENPFTMTLPEMVALFSTEDAIMTDACVMNPVGGSWLVTAKMTGMSISKILEYAKVKDGATAVMSIASDGWNRGIYLSELAKDDALLTIKMNDEPLSWQFGYPVSTMNGAGSAASCIRNVVELRVVSDEKIKTFDGWYYTADGTPYNIPNVGIMNFQEGQIIPMSRPYTFEGYADAYDDTIVAIEFSLDQGKTWSRYETPDSDRRCWIHWTFTYTPEQDTSYVLTVRAQTEDGTYTTVPEQVMFNAR